MAEIILPKCRVAAQPQPQSQPHVMRHQMCIYGTIYTYVLYVEVPVQVTHNQYHSVLITLRVA